MKRRICVVTSSRADFGHLQWVMTYLKKDPRVRLQVVVTGSHLSRAHGTTLREIQDAGISESARIPIIAKGDSVVAITQAAGMALSRFAKVFDRLKPELLLVVGDRYEIHSAVTAALLAKIPVAHIAGGDITEGAFDDALRHSITKMAHLHFVTNAVSAKRIRHMGENPSHIFNVGNPALDHVTKSKLFTKNEIEEKLAFKMRSRNILITFHPVTLDTEPSDRQFKQLLSSLNRLGDEYGLIFTRPNADPAGQKISKLIDHFVKTHSNAIVKASLGHLLYLSIMNEVDLVVGNSSSGIYEAPTFKIPTVNIGNRQKGRLRAASVIDCAPSRAAISRAIRSALAKDCSQVENPYGRGNSSEQIYKIIRSVQNPKTLIQKKFYDAGVPTKTGPVYVIAEAGVNHGGSLKLAKKLIDAASQAGANAVKFQTFDSDMLVTRQAKKAKYQQDTTGKNGSQYEMLKKLELSQKDHFALKAHCKKRKIDFLSTPFDLKSLDFLINNLQVRKIKISSGDITNGPLLLKAAESKLPIILSTGMSTLDEIEAAVRLIEKGYRSSASLLKSNLKLLHCTSEYPASFSDMNLLSIDFLRNYFQLDAGLSDHSSGIAAAIAAVGRGASIIEKHITLNKSMAGPDHRASLDPNEFRELVRSIRQVEEAMGSYVKRPAASELKNRSAARKSIVASKPIKRGERLTRHNLALKRPGVGISPMNLSEVIGRLSTKNYKKDDIIVI